jgi:catechol 2,3-dioxygenase-like lactoylglutathione lyase family enzyme
MQAKLDHVVLWVADPFRSLEFYERVVGLTPVRADEFREGKAPFPSVRVSSDLDHRPDGQGRRAGRRRRLGLVTRSRGGPTAKRGRRVS